MLHLHSGRLFDLEQTCCEIDTLLGSYPTPCRASSRSPFFGKSPRFCVFTKSRQAYKWCCSGQVMLCSKWERRVNSMSRPKGALNKRTRAALHAVQTGELGGGGESPLLSSRDYKNLVMSKGRISLPALRMPPGIRHGIKHQRVELFRRNVQAYCFASSIRGYRCQIS
jgi:hypothetical protein